MRRLLLTAVFFAAAGGCLIVTDNFSATVCTKDSDCSGVNGYQCVSSASWPQVPCDGGEKDCTCEVAFPPPPFTTDASIPDAGPPPDYCADIKPILNSTCIFTCHGAQMGYPNSPPNFRLDYWFTPLLADAGPGVGGVQSELPQIDSVVYTVYFASPAHNNTTQMPPLDFAGASMTEDQRSTIHRWIRVFGGPLGDGSCEADGGNPDGGAPISFASDVVPIFTTNCSCHTTASPQAGMSLTPGNAYNNLVNVPTSAGCNGGNSKRVVPNSTATSMLWLKLSNAAGKCNGFEPNGAAMPFNASNPTDFAKIQGWIEQGAKNN